MNSSLKTAETPKFKENSVGNNSVSIKIRESKLEGNVIRLRSHLIFLLLLPLLYLQLCFNNQHMSFFNVFVIIIIIEFIRLHYR